MSQRLGAAFCSLCNSTTCVDLLRNMYLNSSHSTVHSDLRPARVGELICCQDIVFFGSPLKPEQAPLQILKASIPTEERQFFSSPSESAKSSLFPLPYSRLTFHILMRSRHCLLMSCELGCRRKVVSPPRSSFLELIKYSELRVSEV